MNWSLRTRNSLTALIAPVVVLLTACQNAADASIPPPAIGAGLHYTQPAPINEGQILNVQRTGKSGEVALTFAPGTTYSTARAIGHQYNLELTNGPFSTGPLAAGRYLYEPPSVIVQPITPTTAWVYFPEYESAADRRMFLADNHLRLMHWLHPDDGVVIALVKLPEANLNPQLIDPMQGLFRVTLPAGLGEQSVVEWAQAAGLQLVSYSPETGIAILHPPSWIPPVMHPVIYYAPVAQPNPAPTPP